MGPCSGAFNILLLLLLLLLVVRQCSAGVQMRKLMLSHPVVRAIRPLCKVPNVTSVSSCAQLCQREANCAATHYRSDTKQCDLLTARLDGLEGAAALAEISSNIEVWAIDGRGLGECPPSFTASWRSSRYRLVTLEATWHDAERMCREQGGKLAELTSQEELLAVANEWKKLGAPYIHLGGAQLAGAGEPAGGWRWYRSGLTIERNFWSGLQPDNSVGQEHVLMGWLASNQLLVNDVFAYARHASLCECQALRR